MKRVQTGPSGRLRSIVSPAQSSNSVPLYLLTDPLAPMFDRIKIETETKVVVGTLFNEETLSEQDVLLRTYPNAAVDQAWKEVTDVGILVITSDEVRNLGKDPSNTVRIPSEWGSYSCSSL